MIRFESFPYGSAPAFRTFQLSKLAALCGCNVTVIAKSINADDTFYDNWKNKNINIECISVEDRYNGSYSKAVNECLNKGTFELIIRPSSIRHYYEVDRIVRRNRVPQIFDSVEWYDATNWRLQHLDYRYYKFLYMWYFVFKKADGIIAISRLIQEHFKKMNSNVVRIPTITDCENTIYRTKIQNSIVRFVFSGQLDRGKDNLDTFIEALDAVDKAGIRSQLDIYGPDLKTVQKHLGKKSYLLTQHKNIIIHGRVPQEEAQQACLNCDYSVFFRLNRRSANAGFPTKLGECMTFGTPAICNDTGDISLVMNNRINGFLLKTKTTEEIKETLKYILGMTVEEREQMRKEARKSAEQFFDYRNYENEFQKILESVTKGKSKNGSI